MRSIKIKAVLRFTKLTINLKSLGNAANVKKQKQPQEVSYEKRCFKNFAKITGKHMCQNFFFNKVAALRSSTLMKKRL